MKRVTVTKGFEMKNIILVALLGCIGLNALPDDIKVAAGWLQQDVSYEKVYSYVVTHATKEDAKELEKIFNANLQGLRNYEKGKIFNGLAIPALITTIPTLYLGSAAAIYCKKRTNDTYTFKNLSYMAAFIVSIEMTRFAVIAESITCIASVAFSELAKTYFLYKDRSETILALLEERFQLSTQEQVDTAVEGKKKLDAQALASLAV